jgi:pimeloyl-ACP methyl ester carboxylesterase
LTRLNKLFVGSLLSTLMVGHTMVSQVQAADAVTPSLTLAGCFVEGVNNQLQCGKLSVPENWAQPTDINIDLNVIVVKAISNTPKPDPLFLLMGGPGQAASELVSGLIKIFHDVHQDRDLVFVDQRGTGLSSPLLCDEEEGDIYKDVNSDFDVNDIKKCLADFNVDLSQYNTNSAILDFDAVRVALGYDKINLYGISYGSRAAMVYMRDKPEALRSVILDGVVPPQVVVGPMGIEAARAFDILIEQCKTHQDCQKQYPNLVSDYQNIRAQLEIAPIRTTIDHPVSDKKIALNIDSKKFINTLRNQLYSVGRRELLPYIINEFAQGNYKPFVGLMSQNEDSSGSMYVGLTFNILCNEDIPRASKDLLAKDSANTFSGRHTFEVFSDICKHWPTFTAPANFGEQVNSTIPTMLLSGELDPVTPPAWAEIAAKGLTNSKHYIAKNAGHGLVTQTCAGSMIGEFVDSLNLEEVDSSCLDKQPLPGFLLNNNSNMRVKGQK